MNLVSSEHPTLDIALHSSWETKLISKKCPSEVQFSSPLKPKFDLEDLKPRSISQDRGVCPRKPWCFDKEDRVTRDFHKSSSVFRREIRCYQIGSDQVWSSHVGWQQLRAHPRKAQVLARVSLRVPRGFKVN